MCSHSSANVLLLRCWVCHCFQLLVVAQHQHRINLHYHSTAKHDSPCQEISRSLLVPCSGCNSLQWTNTTSTQIAVKQYEALLCRPCKYITACTSRIMMCLVRASVHTICATMQHVNYRFIQSSRSIHVCISACAMYVMNCV
jgi:hypothetical protein